MARAKKALLSILLGFAMVLSLCFGIVFSMPMQTAKAATLATTNWSLAREGDGMFRVQNGETYWSGYTNSVTTASMLDYTEINGKTLSEINAEKPGSVTVTLQPAGGTIGSFYRVNINTEIAGFTVNDVGTFVIRGGWSHTDSGVTYTIDTDLYFAHAQNKWASDTSSWKYIPASQVVDITDSIQLEDQGIQMVGTRSILIKTSNNHYWTADPVTPNEGGGSFLNMLYVNGTSVKDWNKQAHAALEAGEITDITYGATHGIIVNNKGDYAPIFVSNSNYVANLGSISQVWIPTGYISDVSSFKVAKGFANLQGDTLYYVSKDVEYVRSGSEFTKISGTVDISDAFKIIVQDYTSTNGTMLYYLHTNNVKYWTQQYGAEGSFAINEKEWKGQAEVSLQGGAVQMSYIEFNGTPIYDINANDNGAYGATQGNIASGGKYAPILAFLTTAEMGDSIKLQVPSAYPTGSGTAADNHKSITIKKGFYVVDTSTNIKYEVTKDIQWEFKDGAWSERYSQIETTVTDARIFGSASDAFAGIALQGSNYSVAPATYPGGVKTAKEFAQSANFLSHILIDDKPLVKPGEAFLNVWGNYGYFTFRPGNNSATKITILAGCEFPTYKTLSMGTKEVYVTTEDITFVKDGSGNWVVDEGEKVYNVTFMVDDATYQTQEVVENECASVPTAPTKASDSMYTYTFSGWYLNDVAYDFSTPVTENITLKAVFTKTLKTGEYATSINKLVYARDNKNNWMMFTLTEKDYPKSSEVYNVETTEAKISALNLYDKIVVDGYTLRARINMYGNAKEAPKINLWVADCFAIRIAGAEGALNGAKKVTIRAGAQLPSYAYITEGVEAYYVTTEEITFVNVGDVNGVWERQYRATFVADGEIIETIPYLESQGFTAPEVPKKDGYIGKWESYTAKGNITVNAVYSEKVSAFEYETSNVTDFRWDGDGASYVTFYLTHGENVQKMYGENTAYKFDIYNLWENIRVTTKNGNEYSLKEVYAGDGGDSWYISFGNKPSFLMKLAANYRKGGSDPIVGMYIPKGTEFPSFDYYGEKAYVTSVDAMYEYNGSSSWTYIFTENSVNLPEGFGTQYTLSDLYNVAYDKSACFQDGFERWEDAPDGESSYRYGYVDPEAFTLSFDFKFTGAAYYETFNINLGTEGYQGNKYHFGWRFYLSRGSVESGQVQDICVEYFSNTSKYEGNIPGSAQQSLCNVPFVEGETYHITIAYKLIDAATGEVQVYTSVNQFSRMDTYILEGTFGVFAPYANSLTMNPLTNATVTICDPFADMDSVRNSIILQDGNGVQTEIVTDKYVLPALNAAEKNMGGCVFVGWTTDTAKLTDLYPAGYEYSLASENVTLYPVWIDFSMRNGAAVRKAAPSGIRFLVDVDRAAYDLGVSKGFITEIGTILCPTNYLTARELTHALGEGYFMETKATEWNDSDTYSVAYVNISADQYARAFSARGYMKIKYTTGEGYIYTAYDANEHARSMYQVANAASKAGEQIATDVDYINKVADIVIDAGLNVIKNTEAEGSYTINSTMNGNELTITVSAGVKSVMINGVRLVMGYEAKIEIAGAYYTLDGYSLSSNGLTFTFALEKNANSEYAMKKHYISVIQSYLDSDAYTAEHKAYIVDYVESNNVIAAINESNSEEEYYSIYTEAIAEIECVKTAAELKANNTSKKTLARPEVSKGLGYSVTWAEIADADYYIVHDDNDYREKIVVKANGAGTYTYEAEVVGNHNVSVTAHSYFEEYNSVTSNTVATPEVKPVFSYKSMQDGLYKFSSSQMSKLGIPTSGYYYDSSDSKYFAYYNKDIGWTPYPSHATDWTSPAEFPAHAQRLKDMGNNIILVAYDTNAMFKTDENWVASRLRYVMDTAWSMGMKVLVCDQTFYKLSMSDNSGTGATSKEQVKTAIDNNKGFVHYVTHPAFYGFSLDDEPYAEYLDAMKYTISALDEACEALGVSEPFYLACLFQSYGSDKVYTGNTLINYYKDWLNIPGVDNKYLYVDIYTQHAMDYPFYSVTNRYENSFDAVYGDLGGKYDFYQAITSHTQNDGTLSEQDLYMSLLYAAAHDVAGYSWFCYFPIAGELAGCMVGYDGNGYGNGIGNNASGSYYNAAKTAGAQYELIQGWLDGYDWKTRKVSDDLLTTTLSNGTNTATMYVNADEDKMKNSVTVTASGSTCYLIGYGVGTDAVPYQALSGSVTLAPGQAVICIS